MGGTAFQQQCAAVLVASIILVRSAIPFAAEKFPGNPSGDPIQLRVDLNQADTATMSLMPGISFTQAQRIVELRRTQGTLRNLSELTAVRGIGAKTVHNLESLVLARQAYKSLP